MKLMILDGNSVINRAFYGVRPLTTRDGLYTNAIYGFLNILEKERSEEKPDALCVAFDLHAPTFRHLRYDGYKATRHPMPEELAMQMPVMNGLEAARAIRKLNHPEARSIPIIALTANAYQEDMEACMAAGMNEHLAKPIRIEEVVQVLAKYL